jgi:Na+/melibiose symporter-like transporter
VPLQPTLVLGALVSGVCDSPRPMIEHMLIGWVIDEDALARGGLRREGMFWACNGVCQHLSEVVIALLIAIFGLAGLDSRRCPDGQPAAATAAIEYTFLIGSPVICVAMAALALAYPIKGERLQRLKAGVAAANAHGAAAPPESAAPPDAAVSAVTAEGIKMAALKADAPPPA